MARLRSGYPFNADLHFQFSICPVRELPFSIRALRPRGSPRCRFSLGRAVFYPVSSGGRCQPLNYRAPILGFVSFVALTLVFEFLRAPGLRLPPVPGLAVPVCMILLWTARLVLAASWQRPHGGARNEHATPTITSGNGVVASRARSTHGSIARLHQLYRNGPLRSQSPACL